MRDLGDGIIRSGRDGIGGHEVVDSDQLRRQGVAAVVVGLHVRQRALLAEACLILEPHLDASILAPVAHSPDKRWALSKN